MALASLLLLITAANDEGLSPHEGMLEVPGGRVWYRVVGSGTGLPLILLHGGPGASSHYLEPLATREFYRCHFCRSDPWPPELEASLSPDQFGQSVYEAMWGPNEFTVSGSLRSYVATEHLKELTLPVLYTTGRFDLATPSTVDLLHRVTPASRMVVFEKSGHMTMLDERERYLTVLRQFLGEAEKDVRSGDESP